MDGRYFLGDDPAKYSLYVSYKHTYIFHTNVYIYIHIHMVCIYINIYIYTYGIYIYIVYIYTYIYIYYTYYTHTVDTCINKYIYIYICDIHGLVRIHGGFTAPWGILPLSLWTWDHTEWFSYITSIFRWLPGQTFPFQQLSFEKTSRLLESRSAGKRGFRWSAFIQVICSTAQHINSGDPLQGIFRHVSNGGV